jgi:hypothetical protein
MATQSFDRYGYRFVPGQIARIKGERCRLWARYQLTKSLSVYIDTRWYAANATRDDIAGHYADYPHAKEVA